VQIVAPCDILKDACSPLCVGVCARHLLPPGASVTIEDECLH
jgi:hypothetical protein